MTDPLGPGLTEADGLWLDRPVPRYTSYPPAPAFHDGVTREDYARSLAALPSDTPVSLYLHIPFCRSLCLYCGCHTAVTNRPDRVRRYLDALMREAALVADRTGRRVPVRRLHLGGGTPNILTDDQTADLFAALRATFDMSACREIAVELDPRAVTPAQSRALHAVGVNRVSLGVQDINEDVQQAIGRMQPLACVAEAVAALRQAGIAAINMDLIYGLPLQSAASMQDTVRDVLTLWPDRVALFSYAHVPQMKRHQQALEAYAIPDARLRVALEHTARMALIQAGYVAIGMDHFARPDDPLAAAASGRRLRRNFQGYTDDDEEALIGLGASAIGMIPGGFVQNERDTDAYEAEIMAGRLAVLRGILTQPEDRLRARIIERLMCDLTCDVAALADEAGMPMAIFDEAFARLEPLIAAGLVARRGDTVSLVSPHRMAIRVVAHAFDAYAGKASVASKAA